MLTFPLPLAEFYDIFQVMEGDCHLPELLAMSRDGAGNLYVDDLGDRLWMGSFMAPRRTHAELRRMDARLSILREAGASFMVCDPRALGPAYDPDGVILGASTPVINSLHANGVDLTISGLPASYQITQGDRIAWTYVVSGVTKYAYHKVVVGRTANGSGLTGQIQVSPGIRAGVVVGASVVLIRPSFKALYVPNSYQSGMGRAAQSEGLSFSFMQTLKG